MPQVPPAPPTFSTTSVWPSVRDIWSPTRRVTTSVAPPAANGTITVIGLFGYWAAAGALCNESASRLPAIRRYISAMVFLPPTRRRDDGRRVACRVMCTPHGCSAEHPNVSRRSAHPSMRGERSKVANPGRKNAPRERDGLFDIVSCEVRDPRPHPEERACASAPAKSNARARVSKDEDSHGMAFETHRSALGLWKRLRSRLAAMLLSMRANQPAAV